MSTTTLSSDYRISLPEEVRVAMHLRPGQEFELTSLGSVIQLIPKLSTEELRAAVAVGITSGQGLPSGEVFGRLETKYRNLSKK